MIQQKEIDLLRREMLHLKDCITKYVGYVLAGSGAVVYGIARISKSAEGIASSHLMVSMSYISLVVSIIISFITIILFYKFHSHNRFAGYCRVLSHEQLSRSLDNDIDDDLYELFGWEMAVSSLRYIDKDYNKVEELIDNVNIIDFDESKKERLKEYIRNVIQEPDDNFLDRMTKLWNGIKILFQALMGKVVTESWAYPPFVTAICFVLSLGFFAAGCYNAINANFKLVLIISLIITFLFQVILWRRLIEKLYDIMKGSQTVESFFVKFIPIRANYLNSYRMTPRYLDLDNILS